MRRTAGSVAEAVARDVQVLPDDEGFDGTKLQSFERVLNTEAVFAGILADLIEVPLDELLLLDKLHVGEGFGRKFNSLSQGRQAMELWQILRGR